MIHKIIELEIIDVAWLEIIRKHPDIELGSDGKQIRLPRNQQLTCSCNPSVITERPFKASSVRAIDDFLLCTSAVSGSFHVMDAKSGRNMSTVALPVVESTETKLWIASVSKCTNLNNPAGISRIVILSISRRAAPTDPAVTAVPGTEPKEVSTVCYSLFVLELLSGSILDSSKDHGKHYSKKHGLPGIKCSVLHSKTIEGEEASADASTDPNELMNGFSADISPDGETLLYTVDGQMQCFCLAPVHNTVVSLKAAGAVKDATVANQHKHMTTIEDEKELTDFGSNTNNESSAGGQELALPNFESSLATAVSEVAAGIADGEEGDGTKGDVAQCLLMFGLSVPQAARQPKAGLRNGTVGKSVAGSAAGNAASSTATGKTQSTKQGSKPGAPPVDVLVKDNSLLATNSLAAAVVSATQPVLTLLGLFFSSPVVHLPSPPGSGAYLNQTGGVNSNRLARWNFSGLVTAVESDCDRCLLLAGLDDGSVYLINLKSLTLLQCVGKHEVAVTALAFSQALTGSHYFLVSGAGDGSMCFFKVITTDSKDTDASALDSSRGFNFMGTGNESPVPEPHQGWSGCLRAELLDYRHDFTQPVVSIKGFGKYPIVCAQSAPMLLSTLQSQLSEDPVAPYQSHLSVATPGGGCYTAVYDVEAMKLMGKLVLYEGMQAQGMAWKLACENDIRHMQPSVNTAALNRSQSEESAAEDVVVVEASQSSAQVLDKQAGAEDMFRRAAKFSSTPLSVVSALRPYSTLSVCCASSFCGLFLRQSSGAVEPVMAVYLIHDIIESLTPGIKSLLALYNDTDNVERIGGKNSSLNAQALYSAFSVEERWQSSYTLDNIPPRFRSLFSNVLESRSRSKNKGSRVVLATASSTTSMADDMSRSKMSRKFDRNPTTLTAPGQPIKLTEEKLLAFQQTIDPLSEHQEQHQARHLGEACSAHIQNPMRTIRSSIEKNQGERHGRKNKILKRLSYLADAIQ